VAMSGWYIIEKILVVVEIFVQVLRKIGVGNGYLKEVTRVSNYHDFRNIHGH